MLTTLGEHKFLFIRAYRMATRNGRRGSCRSDFLASRVYISDRVSNITRPYVSCVILYSVNGGQGHETGLETTQRSIEQKIGFDQVSIKSKKVHQRNVSHCVCIVLISKNHFI